MNTALKPPRRWRRILLSFAAVLSLSFGLLAWCIYDVATLSRDAARLRKTFLSANGARASTAVQFSAGPGLLGLARLVVSQIKDVPAEARLALRSVRSASVGVYQFDHGMAVDAAAVEASDQRMRLHGWRRAVGVRSGSNTVLIYTPEKSGRGPTVDVCLAVQDNRELVLVSGTIDGRGLLPLITEQLARKVAPIKSNEQI